MHTLVLALALFAADPESVPVPPTPAPQATVTPTPVFELPFSAVPPPEMPAASDWRGAQTEGLIVHSNVPVALKAEDPTTLWLVDRKICDPLAKTCRFLLHFSMVKDKSEKEIGTTVMRYVFRGPKGVIVEGYAFAPGLDPTVYRFYRRTNDTWTESGGAERVADYRLLGNLVDLVNALAHARQLSVIRQ